MTCQLAIDIGTQKIRAAVGECEKNGRFIIRGFGSRSSAGAVKQGIVVNIESAVEAIRFAVSEANNMAGIKPSGALVGIGGAHLIGHDFSGSIKLNGREITSDIRQNLMDQVEAQAISPERSVLSVIPKKYSLDNLDGIREPTGMFGDELHASVHVITGATHAVHNLKKCLKLAGLEDNILIPQPYAVSQLLSDDERELGIAIVDIGAGTTDLMIVFRGAPVWTSVLPMAGELLTQDLAIALKTPLVHAANIKCRYGFAHENFINSNENISIPKLADRPPEAISSQQLTAYLQPRVEEILEVIGEKLRHSGYLAQVSTGIVLVGGSSSLRGLSGVAESILQCPVRILRDSSSGTLSGLLQDPANAVLAGLFNYGEEQKVLPKKKWPRVRVGVFNQVFEWIQKNF